MTNRKFSLKEIKDYTLENSRPLSVHWAITSSCNLKCTHCYMDKNPTYVSLKSALETITFLKEKGFLIVTLSGGECITHPYFKIIYTELKKAGMLVNIFTNGTAFTDEIFEVLGEYKPNKVEVSIYGYDEESFYNTTGSRVGFSLFKKNIKRLKELNINTLIKAPITKKNKDILDNFIDFAKEENLEYKFGTYIFPMLNGDKRTLKERLEPEEIIEIEFKDNKSIELFNDLVDRKDFKEVRFEEKCSACLNNFVLNSDNSFSYCGMMIEPRFKYNYYEDIEEAYNKVLKYREKVKETYMNSPCAKCKVASYCPGCPAHLLLENVDYKKCNKYFKDVTELKLMKCRDKIIDK